MMGIDGTATVCDVVAVMPADVDGCAAGDGGVGDAEGEDAMLPVLVMLAALRSRRQRLWLLHTPQLLCMAFVAQRDWSLVSHCMR